MRPHVAFWQNMPAHHQVGALDRLAETWGAPVTCVWCGPLSKERADQGWPVWPRRHVREVTLPASGWEAEVDALVDGFPAETVHVFSGIGAYPPVTRALRRAARRPQAKVVVMAESPIMTGWRRVPRLLKAFLAYRTLGRRLDALLAMGTLAEEFYAGMGVDRSRIHPYAYQSPLRTEVRPGPDSPVGLVAFGQLHPRKGFDRLLRALEGLPPDVTYALDLYGDGPERARLEAMASRPAHRGSVRLRGAISATELASTLPHHACAVVPSRFDGWGMAVNEALQAGVPVLASDKVGAADLVRASGAGAVFSDEASLRAALLSRLRSPDLLGRERRLAAAFSNRITPSAVGDHLRLVLEHVCGLRPDKPVPPWADHAPRLP